MSRISSFINQLCAGSSVLGLIAMLAIVGLIIAPQQTVTAHAAACYMPSSVKPKVYGLIDNSTGRIRSDVAQLQIFRSGNCVQAKTVNKVSGTSRYMTVKLYNGYRGRGSVLVDSDSGTFRSWAGVVSVKQARGSCADVSGSAKYGSKTFTRRINDVYCYG